MNSSPDFIEVSAGHLSCLLDRSTLFLRRLRWSGVEVVRAIYAAVRDQNWDTVPPQLERFDMERANGKTTIRFSALCAQKSARYAYDAVIIVTKDELRFEFAGEAQSDFLRNRIGLCVLHPISLCAGTECTVDHADGSCERLRFPQSVRPDQPFKEIRKMRHAVNASTAIEIAFEGEVFEMEDQRNWTDSSFKTYGTPLSLPFPQAVRKGERLKQAVTVKLITSGNRDTAAQQTLRSPTLRLSVDYATAHPARLIGLGSTAEDCAFLPAVQESLRQLKCDHLRIDCRLGESGWEKRLAAAVENARAIGAELHVAAFLDTVAEAQLRALGDVCVRARAPVKLWMIFGRDKKCTPPELVKMARRILGSTHPNVPFAAGTNIYFAELNRERPSADADWHPCFSINPQVHASDEMSMLENLEAQGDVVRSAAAFASSAVVISPVTLRPRFNPNLSEASSGIGSYDPRQSSVFAAAWTLGSIATLAREKNVHSITYFETGGPGGVMSSEGVLYPVYHVFAAVADLATIAESFVEGGEAGTISVIAGTTQSGQKIILAANHTSAIEKVKLDLPMRVRLQTLEITEAAAQEPLWWRNTPGAFCDRGEISIMPGGLVRIELL